MYCSNESNVDVYFDNLQVIHNRGPLLQESHYSPWGLELAGISSKAAGKLTNKYKFNDGSELQNCEFSDGSGLELYATEFRSYDAQIGRFHQIDPFADLAEYGSPYSFADNNPISNNDPYGLVTETPKNTLPEVVVHSTKHAHHDKAETVSSSPGVTTAPTSLPGGAKSLALTPNAPASSTEPTPSSAPPPALDKDHLRSGDVKVSFDRGADNSINPRLESYFSNIMNQASQQGIQSVNISSTTNHPSNASNSAHSAINGARAFDINYINGIHVSTKNQYVKIMQTIIKITPGWRENYGPRIIQKMEKGVAIPAPWAREIPGGHYDHIHVSIPK